jgi:hypothetical protein
MMGVLRLGREAELSRDHDDRMGVLESEAELSRETSRMGASMIGFLLLPGRGEREREKK